MASMFPDVGEVLLLQMALKDTNPSTITAHLYVNDKSPAPSDVLSSYTEMTTQGYEAKELSRSAWTIVSSGGIGKAQHPMIKFVFDGTGGDTEIYGVYFTVNDGTDRIIFAERFANVMVVRTAGDECKVTPILNLRSNV